MELSQNQYLNTTESKFLNLNEGIFVLAVKEDSPFNNAWPIVYINGSEFWSIEKNDIGNIYCGNPTNNNYELFQPVAHELIILSGELSYAETYKKYTHYIKPKFVHQVSEHKNGLFIYDIFVGEIDYSNRTVGLQNTILSPLYEKYIEIQKPFYILDKDNVVGPFVFDGRQSSPYLLKKHESEIIYSTPYNKEFFFEPEIDNYTNNVRRIFLFDCCKPELIKNGTEIDFISNSELINWARNEYEKNASQKDINESAVKLLYKWINNPDITFSFNRYNRLNEIGNFLENYTKELSDFIDVIPTASTLREKIAELEHAKLEKENEILEIDKRKNIVETRLQEIDNQKTIAEEELDKTERKVNELLTKSEKVKKEIEEGLENQLTEKRQELVSLQEQINSLDEQLKIEIQSKKEKLNKELNNIETKIEIRKSDQLELEQTIKSLSNEFLSKQKDAHEVLSDLVKSKTHFDFIRGRKFKDIDLESDNYVYCSNDKKTVFFNKYEDLRSKIVDLFKGQGRYFEDHFIDNLLISTHQNLFTVLAGLPGTGKTSLARILTTCLSGKEKSYEISIGRGWTSQKELFGFYNPLSGSFVEAHKGLYKKLCDIQHEFEDQSFLDNPLFYIILDEANLSPIEHYWSSFINDTDRSFDFNIDLGQAGIIHHENALRFIGTINNDHTTELISPRIIDRINIINIQPRDINFNQPFNKNIEELLVSFKEMKSFFDADYSSDLDYANNERYDAQIEKYKEIKNILKKIGILLSPRIDIAIDRYCRVATKYMAERYRPIDYCIAQRVLPLINIQGDEDARKTLEELRTYLDKLSLTKSVSKDILDKILEIGNKSYNKDLFNYFLTIGY